MYLLVLAAGAVSFVLSLIGTLFIRAFARRVGFVDHPAGHKAHAAPVALGGGVAMTAAIALPIMAGSIIVWLMRTGEPPQSLPEVVRDYLPGMIERVPLLLGVLGCAVFLHIVGLRDDRRPLGPGVKFAVQFSVGLVTAWPLGIRAAEFLPPVLSIALTVLWIVLITNAFNFLDNMDGLSAGVGAIAATIFALASMNAGQVFVPTLAALLVGATLGFLVFNFSPASIFMGDAGSLVMGYLLSVVTVLTTFYDASLEFSPLGVVVPLVVLAVPLYDVTSVVIHRIRLGESPFRGDRRHFSHRLVNRGLSPRGAGLTIYLATAATGLPAIVLPSLTWPGAILMLIQCVCVVLIIAILEHTEHGKRSAALTRDGC